MRRALLILLCYLTLGAARAQKPYDVLDWKAPASLNAYLQQQGHQQYDPRRAALPQALRSEAGTLAYRDSARARFRRLLGPLPPRTALHAQVTGTIARPGFRIEKIIYESRPRHHVTANLYVPDGAGGRPGVLLLCGHEAEAKATASYQQTASLLARNGFVVLVIDPISQGERYQLVDAAGKPLTRGGTTEHTLLNAAANLLGSSVAAEELWDNERGLDYLLTRPEVDAARLGCLGNSGGSTQTAYFIGYDERIKVAALCSYVVGGERTLELSGPADGCVPLPGLGAAGLDGADWPIMFAPKPLLLLAGRYDFVDYPTIQGYQAELDQVYARLGQPARTSLFTYDDGHGISRPKREAAVSWFRRWLYQDARPVAETDPATLPESALRCTATGQVATAFPDELLLPRDYQQRAQALARQRPRVRPRDLPALLTRTLQLPPLAEPVTAERRDTIRPRGIALHPLILRRPGQVPLPVLAALPPGSGPVARVIVWLPDAGKRSVADSVALLQGYLNRNYAVLLADLRGLGETTDPEQFNDKKYLNREYRPALTALHAGSSLLSQRVVDVLTLLRYVEQEPRLASAPVEVHATGRAAPVALHAAVLTPRITQLVLPGLPASFEQLLAAPTSPDLYSGLVPAGLRRYDLPALAAALGPRLVLAAPAPAAAPPR